MVRIVNFKKRQSEDGKEFFVLEITAGIEMVMSQSTGQFYATAKKAYIASTFDEETCKALVGSEMPGSIIKAECEPYEYTIRDTGEVISLSYRYVYLPEQMKNLVNDVSLSSGNVQHEELPMQQV
ncbi:hypothetical protein [Flavobacterium beibuense]|uniref:Uncharacterized protein n=1 Tax=Flavobacterium beibuense TaxID=657326 RepID=A0A444WBT7_9FLAO|nr:hypothetical protein [Flavobacterium beibuense]RYJ43279.1 hypothetical protein NU09_1617 [Flavobacterium beibuense]